MTRGIDHLVLWGQDLGAMARSYQNLGFTLTPKAHHPFGTDNQLAQLQNDFIELLSVERLQDITPGTDGRFSFGGYNQDYLQTGDGFSMIALKSDGWEADRATFEGAGLKLFEPFEFSRKAGQPDGTEVTVGFKLTVASTPEIPNAVFFTCDHQHEPQYFYKPRFQSHANTAQHISEVMMIADEPASHLALMKGLFGEGSVSANDGALMVEAGRSVISVTTRSELSERFLGAGIGNKPGARFVGYGVAVGDIDNDGDRDVFISAVGPNRLLRNDDGRFVDVTADWNAAGTEGDWNTSCGFFDYDNDGWLDLFVGSYVTWSREIDLSQKFTLDGETRAYGPPKAFAGSFCTLYHNDAGKGFTDVSKDAGIQVRNPNTDVPLGKAMGVAPVDVNDDGWMDIIVANDTVHNFLFINNRDGSFTESSITANIAFDRDGTARGAMGIDSAAFRQDGTIAVGIGNFANEASALYMTKPGRDNFVDAAMFTGFGPPTRQGLTFGLFFFDIDLDGRVDVLGANGHLEEEISKTHASQTYAQPPQLFWNAGKEADSELVLVKADKTGPDFNQPVVGRGAAYGDFDNDGDQDVVITTSDGAPRLFRNDQSLGNNFVRLQLVGKDKNRDAIGAVVRLSAGGTTQTKVVMPTKSYLSQSELPLTFGLGTATKIDALEIKWPGDSDFTTAEPPASIGSQHLIEQ